MRPRAARDCGCLDLAGGDLALLRAAADVVLRCVAARALLSMARTVLSSVPPEDGAVSPSAITLGCLALRGGALTVVLSVAMVPA